MKRIAIVVVGIVGALIFLVVVLGILGSLLDGGEVVQESISTPVGIVHQTAQEERIWTVAELVDCDTSTLKFQIQATTATNTRASDCEVELMSRQLETLAAMDGFPSTQKVAVKEHFDIISAMFKSLEQISEDKVIDKQELSYICFVHVQWGNQLQAAEEYIGSLNRDDLVGLEVDIEKLRRVVSTMPDSCGQTE